MKQFNYFLISGILISLLFASACSRPTLVGGDLLDGDIVQLEFTDTISLTVKSVKVDSILTFEENFGLFITNFLLGNVDDPIFGHYDASIFSQLRPNSVNKRFGDGLLDSVVLQLAYDTSALYAYHRTDQMDLQVFRVVEDMPFTESLYNNDSFEIEMTPIGELLDFRPAPFDDVVLIDNSDPDAIDTLTLGPHIRIKLDKFFGDELINLDTSLYSTFDTFVDYFKGMHIRASTDDNSMLGINMNNPNTKLVLYYKDQDIKKTFDYYFDQGAVKFSKMSHDYTAAPVEEFIDDDVLGDSLVFMQGMSGLNIEVDFGDLSFLENRIINHAELDIYHVTEFPDDVPSIFLATQGLLAKKINADSGELEDVTDVITALQLGTLGLFGGDQMDVTEDGVDLFKYTINLTNHFQAMVEGDETSKIYLESIAKARNPYRGIFYGPQNSQFPMKLRLTYTVE